MNQQPAVPVAVLDANVLYPAFLRDVLLRLASEELFLPLWTERILREWLDNLVRHRPELEKPLERTRALMERTFPRALVVDFGHHEQSLAGIHPKDRHVAAAAIQGGATHIVTFNLRDFPRDALAPFGISAVHPDAFVIRLFRANRDVVLDVLERHQADLGRPAHTRASYREAFIKAGLEKSSKFLPLG